MRDWLTERLGEPGIQETLSWVYAVATPIAALALGYLAWTMQARTTIRTRLGTALLLMVVTGAFLFLTWGVLAVANAGELRGWWTQPFWVRQAMRALLGVTIVAKTAAILGVARETRRATSAPIIAISEPTP